MRYKYIIWDWNGTLLDDISASLASVNDMLAERKMLPINVTRYKEIIGVPIRKFYEKCFDLENENYDEILRDYNIGYLKHLSNCGLTEGAGEMLEYFRGQGCKQIIVSSSNKNQLTENVKKYGISEYFDAILGAENYLADSKIERAVNYLNANESGDAVVIGDLAHDAEMAKEIQADCVLITSGHEKPERLAKSGAVVIDKLSELKNLCEIT